MSMIVGVPEGDPPPSRIALSTICGDGLRDVIAERFAQIDRDGFGPEHDRLLSPAQVLAGGETALNEAAGWLAGDFDLDCAREALVRAAASIWATIDRLDAASPLKLTEVAP